MSWRIRSITQNEPSSWYRWHVVGDNLSCEVPTEFYWSVRDLSNSRYFLADDIDDSTRRLFAVARGVDAQ